MTGRDEASEQRGVPVRVLHVLDHSLPLQSGYTYRTLAILQAQRTLNWQTFHLTSPKQRGSARVEETVDGWHFFRSSCPASRPDLPGWRDFAAARATARRLEELVHTLRPTVLHAHSPLLNGYPALWVGRRHRLPVIYEVRAFWEDAAVDQGTAREGDARYRATQALETRLLRRADGVVTICHGLRREIEARGVHPDKITVVPNVVDAGKFASQSGTNSQLRIRLGIAEGSLVLGFIGSFYHYEGLDFLVRSMAKLLREKPELRLLLVGGGPAEAQVRATVDELRLTAHIVLPGRVPHQEVAAYYDLIDVFVYPRLSLRLTELVTPLKPLEAMASGRIVVVSDVGGHRELVDDGRNGFLFAAGDSAALLETLQRVIMNRQRWNAIACQARTGVEKDRSIAQMAKYYGQAFARCQYR